MGADVAYTEKIGNALKVVEAKEETASDQITLSSGVVLRLKKINVLRINAVVEQFKYPKVPEIWDANKDRALRNPDDPEYKALCAEVDAQRTWAVLDAIAALGTEVMSVPPTVHALESNEWIEELQLLKIPVDPDSKLARYMAWIKFVAIVDTADFQKIAEQFGMAMGTAEGKVAESIQRNFPDQALR